MYVYWNNVECSVFILLKFNEKEKDLVNTTFYFFLQSIIIKSKITI